MAVDKAHMSQCIHERKEENPQIQFLKQPLLDLLARFKAAGDRRSAYGGGGCTFVSIGGGVRVA